MKELFEICNYDYDGFLSPNTLKRFNGYSEIVRIPNGIQNIDHEAFRDHREIKELFVPKSLKRICDDAFRGCDNLRTVHFPFFTNSLNYGDDPVEVLNNICSGEDLLLNILFSINSPIEELWFPKGTICITNTRYRRCYSLRKVRLPSTLVWLDEYTFKDCFLLEEIYFSENLARIKNNCFENCRSLKNLVFPKSLKYIGDCAFRGCTNLENITFQDDFDNEIETSHIKRLSVAPNLHLNNIDLVPHVEIGSFVEIGSLAFAKCPSIKEVKFPKEVKANLWYVFSDSNSKELTNTLARYLDNFPDDCLNFFLKSRFSVLCLEHKVSLFERLYHLSLARTDKKYISIGEIQELVSYFITDRKDYNMIPNYKAMTFFLKTFFMVIPIEQSMKLFSDIMDSNGGLFYCKELFKSRVFIRYLKFDNGSTIFESSYRLNWYQQPPAKEKDHSHKGHVSKSVQIEQELNKSINIPITHVWSLVMDQMIKAKITEADLWNDTEPLLLIVSDTEPLYLYYEEDYEDIYDDEYYEEKRIYKDIFASIEEKLQKNQKMSDRIPDLLSSETGNKLEQGVLRWLLMLHTYKGYKNKRKVGLCSEAELVISKINPYSLQYALLFLLINAHKNSNKKAYSIIADIYCRYANDDMLQTLEQYMEIIQRYESCKWYSYYLVRVLPVSENPSARVVFDRFNRNLKKVIPFFRNNN